MVLPKFFAKSSPKKRDSSSSPTKENTPPRSPSKKAPAQPAAVERDIRPTPPKHSKTFPRPSRSPRKAPPGYPQDTHPLNLPPEEREQRRSALFAMSSSPDPMESDPQYDMQDSEPSRTSSFDAPEPTPRGNGIENEDSRNGAKSPIPPPHKTPTEPPPPPKPKVDPEACKAAGNKFFKMRDWDKAIAEYSRGK